MQHLKVRKIGNSLGVVLPKETLAQLGVAEGDVIAGLLQDRNARGDERLHRSRFLPTQLDQGLDPPSLLVLLVFGTP